MAADEAEPLLMTENGPKEVASGRLYPPCYGPLADG